MRKKVLIAIAIVVLAGAGVGVAYAVLVGNRPQGELDTVLKGVSVETFAETTTPAVSVPETSPPATTATTPTGTTTESAPAEGPCWEEYGGSPQRTMRRETIDLGVPSKPPIWRRGVGSLMEFPPVFCDGVLYVNTARGLTLAVSAATGKTIWVRRGYVHASSPAIAGGRLLVSSNDGTVSALDRRNGEILWQLHAGASVESSPVAIGDTAYFGTTNGRLFAVDVASGKVQWAFDTGAKVTASPSIWGNRVCIDTYAGAVFCLNRITGQKFWSTYIKRDAFRYESFYASTSTDGERVYAIARSGSVIALSATSGHIVWRQSVHSWGYTTPAVSDGRVFVGGFDGKLRAFRSTNGQLLWEHALPGYIIGPALVVGDLVFASTPKGTTTFGLRVGDGKVVWSYPAGKFSPGIATNRRYYFSLNGELAAFAGTGQ